VFQVAFYLIAGVIVVRSWRVPWSFRVYRGKGERTPAQLALRLIGQLPKSLTTRYQLMVLADTGFGSVEFIQGVRKLRHHLIVGVRCDRILADGRSVSALHKAGSQVQLKGLPIGVTIAWFYLKRDGKWQKRYVLSTRALKASTIIWWGKRRWQIEGWFKTAKHRFGLHCFAQQTQLGMYRWLILSLVAYLLAHWAYLSTESSTALIDWAKAAETALHLLLPQLASLLLLLEVSRLHALLRSQGFDIQISRCKI
jgi:Transposase DDE domain